MAAASEAIIEHANSNGRCIASLDAASHSFLVIANAASLW